MNPNLSDTLKKYWGFSSFRNPQDKIIENVLLKKDTIALLPTGGGKSLCYQLPALIFAGKTIVVTPLIALMEDQVASLNARGIKAKCIYSGMTYRQIDLILDNFRLGDLKILYISPERIVSDMFKERYKLTKVDLVAIDEAHCISQWGYDFRPAYFEIQKLREWKPDVTFLALTATATDEVLTDISSKLNLKDASVFKKSYQRENISFLTIDTNDKNRELLNILDKVRSSGIVYVRNRGETIQLSDFLNKRGIPALPYHGGMDKDQRSRNQTKWKNNEFRLMISTNAFGMGIDKSDVRIIIHMDIPSSLEEYYQEAGRAGRDGKESWAIVIYDTSDIERARKNLTEQYPEIDLISEVYQQLCTFLKVAYGSGYNESYGFLVQEFSRYIKMPVKNIFHILQILEKEGWILLSDGMHEPTKIQFICDHDDLFEPGFLNENEDNLVIYLLRRYEGLFTQEVKIDEEVMAKETDMPIDEVQHLLSRLEKKGIILLNERKSEPQISFTRERPQKEFFNIEEKRYEELKKRAFTRLAFMMSYLTVEEKCRQKFILEYFGEISVECGKCDYCRFKKEKTPPQEMVKDVLEKLEANAKKYTTITVKDVLFSFPFNKRHNVKKTILFMENEKMISITNNGNIKVILYGN
ncbi:MAG: RecQ family ATP-dependent DNA helicase [Saprospiraceae bacterium]|nr:RecQ family ATP-dependent DNA helicase [Saprospiraceae bacterium]